MGLPPKQEGRDAEWNGVMPTQAGHVLECWAEPPGDKVDARDAVETYQRNCSSVDSDDGEGQSKLAQFVQSAPFQNTTLFVIVLNGLWIGIDVEWNHSKLKEKWETKTPLEPVASVVENIFCTYFTVELVLRFFAFTRWFHFIHDRWFLFDGLLVLMMVLETWVLVIVEAIVGGGGGEGFLSKFSALRLLRLTRLSRIFKGLPELLTLIKGMVNAARAVATVLCLLVLVVYIFAIFFTAQIGDVKAPENKLDAYWDEGRDPTGVDLFGSIGDSMMTLFTRGVLGDNLAETLEAIKDRDGEVKCASDGTCTREDGGSVWLMWVFIIFYVLSAQCLLNMVVGILCEVIDKTAKDEVEVTLEREVRRNITSAFKSLDTKKTDGFVTRDEFAEMLTLKSVRQSMAGFIGPLGDDDEKANRETIELLEQHMFGTPSQKEGMVDKSNTRTTVNTDKSGNNGISLEDFVTKVLDMSEQKEASKLDVELLRVKVEDDEKSFDAQLSRIEQALEVLRSNGKHERVEPDDSNSVHPLNNQSVDARPSPAKTAVGELKSGTSTSAWLQGLPTEALFSVLQERAKTKPARSQAASSRANGSVE